MRIVSIVGARPQFIKLAPIDWALRRGGHDHKILHTGQHYDPAMSSDLFSELDISPPRWNLQVGSGSHGEQTAMMLTGCERILDEERPDWVLCFGDTNSTVAASLAASKLLIPVAHVEAGLRSLNRAMPEEQNRIVTDHLSDLLFAPTQVAMDHLEREGLIERACLVGDVMVDAIRSLGRHGATGEAPHDGYFVATIHRAENTDDPERLGAVVEGLAAVSAPVHLYVHPRLRNHAESLGIELAVGSVEVRDPVGYRALMSAVGGALGVITDSGGLQKEAYLLEVPCTTVRPETEWPETLAHSWNQLVTPGDIASATGRARPRQHDPDVFGDGRSAERIVAELTAQSPR